MNPILLNEQDVSRSSHSAKNSLLSQAHWVLDVCVLAHVWRREAAPLPPVLIHLVERT